MADNETPAEAAVASVADDSEELECAGPGTWDPSQHELNIDGSINKDVAPEVQSHFELEIDPEEHAAYLKYRGDVDKEAVLALVTLAEGVSGEIVQLFKSIDKDGSGELTQDDFQILLEDQAESVAETWAILASKFDANCDGEVSLDEFRVGFKQYGIDNVLDTPINFEAPYDWTLKDWAREIARVTNSAVRKECQVLRGWFESYAGSVSELRSVASRAERREDRVLFAIYMDNSAELQIHRLFDTLDSDKNGTLEAADFAVMSKNAGTDQLWSQFKENFDKNGDEQISFDEFKRNIADTVGSKIPVGSIPRKDWTWRQVISQLTLWANSQVKEQCREIFMYSLCGEYSSVPVGDDEVDGDEVAAVHKKNIESFGCGAELGEAAFPGGEPDATYHLPTPALADHFKSFDQLVADAAGPATPLSMGGVAPNSFSAGAEAAAAIAPATPQMNPNDIIAVLQDEVTRLQSVVEHLHSELTHRPPMTVAFGTSQANMITVQLPQMPQAFPPGIAPYPTGRPQ